MLDLIDQQLLALLRANGREAASALAKKLKVSRGTVQNRITALQARGIIQSFTIQTRPDLDRSRIRAIMCIAIEGEQSRRIVRALRGIPDVDRIFTTNGRWDLVAELNSEDLRAFSQTLDMVRSIEGISSSETSLLLASAK